MFLTVTKKNLLSLVSEYDIYSYYIPNENLTRTMISPLRPKEKNPSFSLFKSANGELLFNDFTLNLKGDCIKFVTEYYKVNGVFLNFYQTLWQIVKDLNLSHNYIDKQDTPLDKNKNVFVKQDNIPNFDEIKHKEIKIKIRNWRNYDFKYWQQFGITYSILKKYNVVPISSFYIGEEMFTADKYAYCYLEKIDDKIFYKIYQPYNSNFKWLSSFTNNIIQGYRQLPEKGDFLIITKSLKDVMSMKATANINAIAFQSENIIPDIKIIKNLKERFQRIVILYDNDFDKDKNHGIIFAKKLSEHTSIPFVYFDDKFCIKDYSEGYLSYGDNIIEILYETLSWEETVKKIEKS